MNRRQFLQNSLGAAVTLPLVAGRVAGQAPAQPPAAPASAAAAAVPIRTRLVLDANSTQLQWLRTPDELAEAAVELACGGMCLSVGAQPAHIDLASLRQQLPLYVNRLREAGVRVAQVKGPDLTNPDDPAVEAFVGTAADAGCTHYSLGTLTYDPAQPVLPQLDALKPRIAKFVALNQRHGMTLTFDTRPTPNAIGAVVWDLLHVIKDFDPKFVGFHWDTGHMALHGDAMWETLMRTAGPYVAAVGWRDREWVQNIGLRGEGGPYPGPPPGRAGGARGGGAAAGRAGRAAGDGAAAGRAGGAAGGGAGARGGGAAEAEGGRGAARGRGAAGGRGSGAMPQTPLGGLVGRGNGWSARQVAMGTGIVDITRVAAILNEINFTGPSELQSQYDSLGAVKDGADRNAHPYQFVIGLLKRDVLTIRKAFQMANTGLAI
jgi:sugar phosphate isomerase/epimerase